MNDNIVQFKKQSSQKMIDTMVMIDVTYCYNDGIHTFIASQVSDDVISQSTDPVMARDAVLLNIVQYLNANTGRKWAAKTIEMFDYAGNYDIDPNLFCDLHSHSVVVWEL
jgi:hypothetical protein